MRNWKPAIHVLQFTVGLTLLAGGTLLLVTPALAADESPPVDDGVVIWNEDYTLEGSEWLDGDLVVFNGDVTLESESRVQGSVIIWNGNAEVEGIVENDLVVSSGDIYLGDDAWVQGNVICSWGCDLEREEGAQVDGGFTEGIPPGGFRYRPERGFPDSILSLPDIWVTGPAQAVSWIFRIIRTVVTILVVAATAGLVALIWPHQTAQVGRTVIQTAGPSFGIGLLTAIAATVLIAVLAFTICLSPVAILGALALGAAGLFGWIGVGALIGEQLLQALKVREATPMWAAGLGTLVITLISAGLSTAFCLAPLGWLIIFVLGCLGLGAVVLTRFGTTAYTPSPPAPPPPAPVEAPEPPEAVEETAEEDEESPEPPQEVEAEQAEEAEEGAEDEGNAA